MVSWPSQIPDSWQVLEFGPYMVYPELHEKLVTDPIIYLPFLVPPLLKITVPFGRLRGGQVSIIQNNWKVLSKISSIRVKLNDHLRHIYSDIRLIFKFNCTGFCNILICFSTHIHLDLFDTLITFGTIGINYINSLFSVLTHFMLVILDILR